MLTECYPSIFEVGGVNLTNAGGCEGFLVELLEVFLFVISPEGLGHHVLHFLVRDNVCLVSGSFKRFSDLLRDEFVLLNAESLCEFERGSSHLAESICDQLSVVWGEDGWGAFVLET